MTHDGKDANKEGAMPEAAKLEAVKERLATHGIFLHPDDLCAHLDSLAGIEDETRFAREGYRLVDQGYRS